MSSRSYILSFLAGIFFATGFAPIDWVGMSLLGIAIIYFVLNNLKCSKAGAYSGLWFGIGKYGLGVSWVFNSIYSFSEVHWVFCLLITFLFICVLSLYEMLFFCVFLRLRKQSNLFNCLLFAALFTLCELVRAKLFGGFPWLLEGHALINTPIRIFGPLIGSDGMSFIGYLSAAFLASTILYQHQSNANYLYGCGFAFFFVFPSILSFNALPSAGKPLKVSLIQGNTSHDTKWKPGELLHIFNTYNHLTNESTNADLIIWPETAIPIRSDSANVLFDKIKQFSLLHHNRVILGLLGENPDGSLTNSLFMVGEKLARYDKYHLVPFGEYMPFPRLYNFYHWFNIPFANLSTGQNPQLLFNFKDIQIAPFICFEIAFNDQFSRSKLAEAELLLTVTDDSWFGQSFAKAQHLQIAQVRSLESSKPQIFATNNGITALIDDQGKIAKTLPVGIAGKLTGKIQPHKGVTPYLKVGHILLNYLILIIISLSLIPYFYKFFRYLTQIVSPKVAAREKREYP